MTMQDENPTTVPVEARTANLTDLENLRHFLSREDIDGAFQPALSDLVRGVSIQERVQLKFQNGAWIIAESNGNIVGCLAIVPASIPLEVPPAAQDGTVSLGVSLTRWQVEKLMELSTVVTDPKLRAAGVKGIGKLLVDEAIQWILHEGKGNWGLITDSWFGGPMGGFIKRINGIDTLLRVYTDPGKRGPHGPLTTVYGVVCDQRDREFFESLQPDIATLERVLSLQHDDDGR
ncbi:hypothetical protein A3D08_00805 [Candidatus Roizmanbacteria bacterium RIFCSPHIGHO2_02_FULL_43_11]|nr:MAG: hypothetical protein A3D08_00805 [Candidatus Roizmanbacteria bacterium RIFCSPHIGHO2_02_FULL_43_11]